MLFHTSSTAIPPPPPPHPHPHPCKTIHRVTLLGATLPRTLGWQARRRHHQQGGFLQTLHVGKEKDPWSTYKRTFERTYVFTSVTLNKLRHASPLRSRPAIERSYKTGRVVRYWAKLMPLTRTLKRMKRSTFPDRYRKKWPKTFYLIHQQCKTHEPLITPPCLPSPGPRYARHHNTCTGPSLSAPGQTDIEEVQCRPSSRGPTPPRQVEPHSHKLIKKDNVNK